MMGAEHDHGNGHVHSHDHAHGHGHGHEVYSARPHPEFVVLEIGEDVGALIVHTDPDLHGTEIELSPAGEDDRRQHKDVLERSLGGRSAFTAVFNEIPEGRYTLWSGGEARERDVEIVGGAVLELNWKTTSVALM